MMNKKNFRTNLGQVLKYKAHGDNAFEGVASDRRSRKYRKERNQERRHEAPKEESFRPLGFFGRLLARIRIYLNLT